MLELAPRPFAKTPDALETQLVAGLVECSLVLARFGIKVPATSPKALEKLSTLSSDDKERLLAAWRLWLGWVKPAISEQGTMEVNRLQERRFAEKALAHFNLRAHADFWETLRDGQIIEIYGLDMIQLYRSLSFFKFCGYSLLDISVHEWYVLWDRPKRAIELLVDYTQRALSHDIPCESFTLPRHIIRESFSTGLTEMFKPRAYLAEFKHFGTLTDADGRPAGIICTSEGEFLAEGDAAFAIQFV